MSTKANQENETHEFTSCLVLRQHELEISHSNGCVILSHSGTGKKCLALSDGAAWDLLSFLKSLYSEKPKESLQPVSTMVLDYEPHPTQGEPNV